MIYDLARPRLQHSHFTIYQNNCKHHFSSRLSQQINFIGKVSHMCERVDTNKNKFCASEGVALGFQYFKAVIYNYVNSI